MANRNPLYEEIIVGATCTSEQETRRLGFHVATSLTGPAVLSLEGPLGAGKTCFVKGLAEGLGIDPANVSSPTFTLVHEYENGRIPLVHLDLYRIDTVDELASVGLDEYVAQPIITAIEWGGKFPNVLPAGAWRVSFSIEDTARKIRASLIS